MIWFLLGFALGSLSGASLAAWLRRDRPSESFTIAERAPIPPSQYRQRTAGEEERKTATVRRLQIRQRRNDNPSR